MHRASRWLTAVAAAAIAPGAGSAQEACRILCAPDLKLEPTVTFENLGDRARVDVGGVVEETAGETIFELIFAVEETNARVHRCELTFNASAGNFQRLEGKCVFNEATAGVVFDVKDPLVRSTPVNWPDER